MDDPILCERFPQRSVDWFEQHAHEFDRIVYQFGNSTFHAHMFGLLERHPGVVVLHDFFMSGVLSYEESRSPLPNHYCRMLYLSHGYQALVEEKRLGRAASCHTYPCNKRVLDHAIGVIAHSIYSIELAQRWYGPELARKFHFLPLQRPLPPIVDKAAARRELGVAEDDILFCSFGILAATKRNDDIVDAWIDSAAGRDPRCHLIFVGEVGNDAFGIDLCQRIAAHPRIRITGYVSEAAYNTHLAAADAAIQLRRGSRGETSGSVLDCLSYGLPTIINAHGSAVEMPATVCLQIADDFSIAELTAALETLRVDRGLRERLSAAARVHIEARTPARVSVLYREAIEAFAGARAAHDEQRLVSSIATLGDAGGADLMQAAAAVAANRTQRGPLQLLVDVTRLAASGASAAASPQRTAVAALVAAAPVGWRVEPVRYDGKCYRYARRFTLDLIGRGDLLIEDAVADAAAGDIVLALGPETAANLPAAWQARGVMLEHFEDANGSVQVEQLLARVVPAAAARQL